MVKFTCRQTRLYSLNWWIQVGVAVCGNIWAVINLTKVIGWMYSLSSLPSSLQCLFRILVISLIKYLPNTKRNVQCATFLAQHKMCSFAHTSWRWCVDFSADVYNAKDWSPFVLLAKLLTLPTILALTCSWREREYLTLKRPERGIVLCQ